MQKIDSVEQFDRLIGSEDSFTLLKHSVTCPISQAAYEEYEKFCEENPTVKSYFLTVQDARPLSNYIAEKFEVKHESPQAFLFNNQNVAWHASHWKITTKTLTKVLEDNQ